MRGTNGNRLLRAAADGQPPGVRVALHLLDRPSVALIDVQADKGRAECMLWAVERPDGGRGFGFTGGHFHDNWSNDDYRKTILNALVWVAKAEVPPGGVESRVSQADLDANLDPKPQPKGKGK